MTDPTTNVQDRLELALHLADAIGAASLREYQSPRLEVTVKDDGSLVTQVDRDSEARIRQAVGAAFPDDGVLGEEFEETAGGSGWRWVVDPIDGTESFIRGIPHYCILIGLEYRGEVLGGVASFPAMGEVLWAARGGGAWWRQRDGEVVRPRVSSVSAFHEAVIEVGSYRAFEKRGLEEVRNSIMRDARRSRGWSDGYAYALVATGRVDGAVQVGLKRWDVSAFIPILREAGGMIGDWGGDGEPYHGFAMACAPGVAGPLLERLAPGAGGGAGSG
ncbi:MAG: hypothetical protein KDA21_14075 [Phycisphaerales bacterium]|nr:hypothetical protein [Phycisphaerales bacterium]